MSSKSSRNQQASGQVILHLLYLHHTLEVLLTGDSKLVLDVNITQSHLGLASASLLSSLYRKWIGENTVYCNAVGFLE